MGCGLKRKIPIEKREAKQQRSVTFSKRRQGLFKKAAELCLQFDARVAVIATGPSSDKSKPTFYSFGHPSVDTIVDEFLEIDVLVPAAANVAYNSVVSVDHETLEKRKTTSTCSLEEMLSDDFGNSENAEELAVAIERIREMREKLAHKIRENPSKSKDQINVSIINPDSSRIGDSPLGDSLSELSFPFDDLDELPSLPPPSSCQGFTNFEEDFIFSPDLCTDNYANTYEAMVLENCFAKDGTTNPNSKPQNSLGNCDTVDCIVAAMTNSGSSEKDNSPLGDSLSQLGFPFNDLDQLQSPPPVSSGQELTNSDEDFVFRPDLRTDDYADADEVIMLENGYGNGGPTNPNPNPRSSLGNCDVIANSDASLLRQLRFLEPSAPPPASFNHNFANSDELFIFYELMVLENDYANGGGSMDHDLTGDLIPNPDGNINGAELKVAETASLDHVSIDSRF